MDVKSMSKGTTIGMIIFVAGIIILIGYGIYQEFQEIEIIDPVIAIGVGAIIIGLLALFISIVIEQQKGKKKKPKVIVRTMVTNDNKKKVKEFTKKWKHAVDEVQYGKVHNFCSTWVEAQQRHLVNTPCLFLWTQLIILSNGDVIPCCMDYEGKLKLGNISFTKKFQTGAVIAIGVLTHNLSLPSFTASNGHPSI